MPILIVDQPNRRFGGRITGRVLIGRLPTNGVALTDSSVSRLHAWLAPNGDGHYYVADTGSLTGTWVNGSAIARRQNLADGDVIRVGKTQITFHDSDMVPMDLEESDLGGQPPATDVAEAGVLFDCPCGAPAWFKATAIGHNHHCRQCDRTVRIPDRSGVVAEEIDAPLISEPGVPPEAARQHDPQNPLLIHEPPTSDLGMTHDEHGLADSGIHNLLSEAEATELHTTPDEHGLAGSGMYHVTGEPQPGDLTPTQEEHGLGDSGIHHALAEPVEAPRLDEITLTEQIPEPLPAEAPPIEEPPPRVKPPLFEPHTPRMQKIALVPDADDVLDLSAAETTQAPAVCSVCHSVIDPGDVQTTCPSCGLTFHDDCWTENLGCSAYGCPQVNALKPPETTVDELLAEVSTADPVDEIEEDASFPWEFIFLGVSVLGTLLGALCYGVPAMIGFVGTLIYVISLQQSRRRRPVAWIAALLCLIGIGVGIYASYLYWKGWPPISPWARSTPVGHPAVGAKR